MSVSLVVVSNTAPLNYLVLIGQVEILPTLFGEVLAPEAVFLELSSIDAPEPVRTWIGAPPPWLRVERLAAPPDAALGRLHAGEREAIQLAQERGADALLIDDRDGRREALRRGLPVTGTLGVLDAAAERGLLDFAPAMTALQETSFRASPELVQSFLDREADQRGESRQP